MTCETPTITILSASPDSNDHLELRRTLAGVGYETITADSCHEALQLLQNGGISVMVCDSNLRDGTWRDVLNGITTSPVSPVLIVSSYFADEHLWAEVLNLGGFDVIAKPFNPRELRHVVQTAMAHRAARADVAPLKSV